MTGTQLATRQNGTVVETDATAGELRWNDERKRLLRETVARGFSEEHFHSFLAVCMRTGLDPWARQIHGFLNNGRLTIAFGIDGLRLIAQRTGRYRGQVGPFWCGRDGVWKDVWLDDKPPEAAKVGIWCEGYAEPVWQVALRREFEVATNPNWKQRPAHMLALRAEAHALRKACQQELTFPDARIRVEVGRDPGDEPPLLADPDTGEIAEADYTPALVQERPAPAPERAPAPPTGARRPVAAATVPPAATAPAPTRREQMATLELGAAIEAGVLEDPEPSTEATQADEDPEHAEALRHYVAAANKAAAARLPHLSPAQVQELSTSEIQDQTTLLLDALNAPQAKARR